MYSNVYNILHVYTTDNSCLYIGCFNICFSKLLKLKILTSSRSVGLYFFKSMRLCWYWAIGYSLLISFLVCYFSVLFFLSIVYFLSILNSCIFITLYIHYIQCIQYIAIHNHFHLCTCILYHKYMNNHVHRALLENA